MMTDDAGLRDDAQMDDGGLEASLALGWDMRYFMENH